MPNISKEYVSHLFSEVFMGSNKFHVGTSLFIGLQIVIHYIHIDYLARLSTI